MKMGILLRPTSLHLPVWYRVQNNMEQARAEIAEPVTAATHETPHDRMANLAPMMMYAPNTMLIFISRSFVPVVISVIIPEPVSTLRDMIRAIVALMVSPVAAITALSRIAQVLPKSGADEVRLEVHVWSLLNSFVIIPGLAMLAFAAHFMTFSTVLTKPQ